MALETGSVLWVVSSLEYRRPFILAGLIIRVLGSVPADAWCLCSWIMLRRRLSTIPVGGKYLIGSSQERNEGCHSGMGGDSVCSGTNDGIDVAYVPPKS